MGMEQMPSFEEEPKQEFRLYIPESELDNLEQLYREAGMTQDEINEAMGYQMYLQANKKYEDKKKAEWDSLPTVEVNVTPDVIISQKKIDGLSIPREDLENWANLLKEEGLTKGYINQVFDNLAIEKLDKESEQSQTTTFEQFKDKEKRRELITQISREEMEKVLPEKIEQARRGLGQLYELLPEHRKFTKDDVIDLMDQTDLNEVLPGLRLALAQIILWEKLRQKPKAEFIEKGMKILMLWVHSAAMQDSFKPTMARLSAQQ